LAVAHTKTLSLETAGSLGETVDGCGVTLFLQEFHGATQFCGAASAQMVLDSLGAGVINQRELFDLISSHSTLDVGAGWHSAPDGIVYALNHRKPEAFLESFQLLEFRSEVASSRAICWSIERGVAPIVLLSSGSHWIVVVGYVSSRAPTGLTDADYEIFRFEVFDPASGKRDIEYAEPDTPNGVVVKEYWKDLVTPVELGRWKDKYLVVRHPNPANPN